MRLAWGVTGVDVSPTQVKLVRGEHTAPSLTMLVLSLSHPRSHPLPSIFPRRGGGPGLRLLFFPNLAGGGGRRDVSQKA